MASVIDMSLEEIIKKKKINKGKPMKINNPKNLASTQKLPVLDARNKIISKKRIQITDARDKLKELAKQKDARIKLEQMRLRRTGKTQHTGRNFVQNQGKFTRNISNNDNVFTDTSRQVAYQHLAISKRPQNKVKQFMKNRLIGAQSSDRTSRPKPIVRTVANDIEIIDDPMDEYSPPKPNSLNRKASLQLRIIARNNDVRDKRSPNVYRTAVALKEKSPPRPISILKKRPMAAMRSESKDQNIEKPNIEYRIIVSNLGNTVTGGDIQELFGDVGGMIESRLVRPGTAEVIYKSHEDAQRAVDLYHNRQLDGQPMNCLLVAPRSPAILPARNSAKPALFSTNSNVEPDISTFHKVLFSNL